MPDGWLRVGLALLLAPIPSFAYLARFEHFDGEPTEEGKDKVNKKIVWCCNHCYHHNMNMTKKEMLWFSSLPKCWIREGECLDLNEPPLDMLDRSSSSPSSPSTNLSSSSWQICLHFMTTHHHNDHCQDEATAEQKCDSSREKCRQHRHVYEVDMPEYKSKSDDS